MKRQPILIAEDSARDALFATHQIEAARILNPLQVVTNGEDIVCYLKGDGEFADREKFPFPVLLLLDLKLPGIGGFEILSFLQSSLNISTCPLLF